MPEDLEANSDDIIRILVATDNHLGYAEKDSIRGEDSFVAFEEILEYAISENVDFILLGGDLFHDAVPSPYTLQRCIQLLNHYTVGSKPIEIEFLNDDSYKFHSAIRSTVNYENPNLNISYPVFSIHGNHDDPSGHGRLSTLDILSAAGLINYFGRWTDLSRVDIQPVLLRKRQTKLALYGLSHIHDPRLARLFESHKVEVVPPKQRDGDPDVDDWFHLMVLHQNRNDRGPKNYIPEDVLPKFLHLVIWGHEHDCRIEPEYNPKQDFHVCQPGSSVPTSLSEGEHVKKHVGLLQINRDKFNMKPLPLKTVRPFVFESINLSELIEELRLDEGGASEKVRVMAEERVKAMIEKAKGMLTGHPKQPTLPLIRLRLVYTDEEQMFNAVRFGQRFNGLVANPLDLLAFKKAGKARKKEDLKFDHEAMEDAFSNMDPSANMTVEDLVHNYFSEVDETKSLDMLSPVACKEMVHRLVSHADSDAAEKIVNLYLDKTISHLMETLPGDDEIKEEIRNAKYKITEDDLCNALKQTVSTAFSFQPGEGAEATVKSNTSAATGAFGRAKKGAAASTAASKENGEDYDASESMNTTTTTRGRGRGRGRGSRASVGRGTTMASALPGLEVSRNATQLKKATVAKKPQTLLDVISQRRGRSKRQTTEAVHAIEVSDSD